MTSMTPPAFGTESAHIDHEITEAMAIYTRLYPTQKLTFIFYQGKDPIHGAPSIIEGPFTFRPHPLSPEYLGRVTRPGAGVDSPEVTITLSIPRRPTPTEAKQTDASWRPVRPLARLFTTWPIGYEKIRYLAEMRRKKRRDSKMTSRGLLRGEGSGHFPPPARPASDKKPAILIGMHWLEVGGAEKLGFDTIRWALEAGLRVFVVASVPALQRLQTNLPDSPDVTFIRLDRYLAHDKWPRFVERLIRDENIGLIHNHHCIPLYESLPQIRAILPWVKVIDSTHIVEYANGGYPRTSGVWSEFVDIHHVISRELVDYYRDNFQVIGKVKLGRMLDRAEPARELPAMTMTPGQNTLRVTFVGRLYYQKRPVVVVEALRALDKWAAANGVQLRGRIIGEGPFLDTLRQMLKRYGLTSKVELLPAGSPVPQIMADSDILLLPSNNEELALVCYEAIEQGCIPISTDVGSQAEIVPADLLVPLEPAACVNGIVSVVDRLWKDAAFCDRQKAELHAAWSRIAADPTAQEILMPVYRDAAHVTEE